MRRSVIHFALIIIAAGALTASAQQNTALTPSTIAGDVVSITETTLVINAASGRIEAALLDGTEYKRVSAEKPSLKTAVAAVRTDISVGDKVIVTGVMNSDGKSLPARAIYLMTSRDIAEKRAKENADWTTNGVSGKVTAVDAATGNITVEVRTIAGVRTVSVEPQTDTVFKRYAPNSIRYDQAVNGSATDIRIGDMLRARGDKSTDGATLTAKEILTGAFRTVAGAVKSVDAEKNEVVITDIQTNTDVTVSLEFVTTMKKFPAEDAQRLAMAQMAAAGGGRSGGNAGGAGERPASGTRPDGQPSGQPGGQAGRRNGGGIDEMLDRFPTITVSEITPGEMIAVSSTVGADATRISAIKLLAGVEPFLRSAQSAGGNRGGRGGAGSGFTIPGLDDADF